METELSDPFGPLTEAELKCYEENIKAGRIINIINPNPLTICFTPGTSKQELQKTIHDALLSRMNREEEEDKEKDS